MDPSAAAALPAMRSRLEEFLSRETGGTARVVAFEPLAGGASREMFSIDVEIEAGKMPGIYQLVLRRDLGGRIHEQSLDRGDEFRVIVAALEAGVSVPRAHWLSEDPEILGTPFFLQDRVQGVTIGRRIVKEPSLATARARLPVQMGEELAKMHRIDTRALAFLPRPPDGSTAATDEVRRVCGELDRARDPHPALELAIDWLKRHLPAREERTFVHGDYRIGNVVVGPGGLVAVLDWEFAHLGDPIEDVAWPLVRAWRFGADRLEMGGVGERAPYLEAYARASGREIAPGHVRFWEILGNVRWAVGCMAQAERHLSGQAPSVELASLGRKAAEMELDVLDLIEKEEG
jgi:aminoglycoside phosphotransferase (APT) family kinase protein